MWELGWEGEGIAVSKHVILALEGPWCGEVEMPGGAELEVWFLKGGKASKGLVSLQVTIKLIGGSAKWTFNPEWSVWALVILKWFWPNRIGQANPGTTSIEKMEGQPFSQIIGTCMRPIALSCEEGLATSTGSELDNLVKVKWGCFRAMTSAWALLTSDKVQQLSIERGRETPADVMGVHKLCLFARSNAGIERWLGIAVIAG